jgi:hypothetical protein
VPEVGTGQSPEGGWRTVPADRSLIASIGGHAKWAKTPDRSAATAPGRKAAADRFRREIDAKYPDVPEAQRAVMAEHAKKAHFLRLALKSAQSRRNKAAARAAARKESP